MGVVSREKGCLLGVSKRDMVLKGISVVRSKRKVHGTVTAKQRTI